MTIADFQKTILDWYKENRRDLPWRKTRDPYKILLSEVMLQQTQISRVLPKYKEFLTAFPDLASLARASDARLLKVWSGLGYWRRAKYLKETAQKIHTINPRINTRIFPKDAKILETFPGIGPYTARALACFAFNNKEAFIDTNIRRVYLHFFFPPSTSSGQGAKKVSDKEILVIAQKAINTLPKGITSREWHYALFDYGAVELKNKQINRRSSHYAKQSKFDGSFRSYRTKAIRFILAKNRVTHKQFQDFLVKELKQSPYTQKEIIQALLKDNLIKKTKVHYSL